MSNAGQAALGIVGGVIGFFVGGPYGAAYGFQLGLLAGTVLFPTQLPHMQGPRLGDGGQTVSTVGAPIAWIHGRQMVGGNIIWASPIREEAQTTTAGGKGGPEQSQTTYKYFRSFAILICEGPIGGVRRIWANGKIIYDRSPPSDGSSLDDIVANITSAIAQQFVGGQAASEAWAQKMTIYRGTEDQMPSPVIEAFEGVGNVPGYRGYALAVFDDVELKPEDGNRIPAQWKFEVYEEGAEEQAQVELYAQEVLYPWTGSLVDPTNSLNTNEWKIDGGYPTSNVPPGTTAPDGTYGSLSSAIGALGRYYGSVRNYQVVAHQVPGEVLNTLEDGEPASAHQDRNKVSLVLLHLDYEIFAPGVAYSCDNIPKGVVIYDPGLFHGNSVLTLVTVGHTSVECAPLMGGYVWDGCYGCEGIQSNTGVYAEEVLITITRTPSAPPSACQYSIPQAPTWCVSSDGYLVREEWEREEGSRTFHVLQRFSANVDGSNVKYPLGPVRPVGHAEDTQAFWEAAYQEALDRGDPIASGLTYGVDYPQTQSYAYVTSYQLNAIDVELVSLATICARICERVGLTAYDVSDLAGIFIIGYQVSKQMLARAAIEPLRSIGFFDVIESGLELKFVARGAAPVLTVDADDLGAHFAGEQPPSAITTKQRQELEMPRMIRVHYQHPGRDLDPGEERSPSRFDTDAESIIDMDLAAAITPDQAAQCAEVLFRELWAAKYSHTTSLDSTYAALEPGDAVLVPIDESLERVRIPAITDRLPILRDLEMLRDDDGSYVSTAVGTSPGRNVDVIQLYGPLELLLLDLPPLAASHTTGIYAAVRPRIRGGLFRGANIIRSIDGGSTYTLVGALSDAQPMGRVTVALPAGPTTVFDEGNTITVELSYGALESRTDADLYEGANAAAIGVHGRWEIFQFRTAENLSGNVWRLSGLLRGRRGTEHNVGLSVAGDTFVMLDDVALIAMEVVDINATFFYRASPVGLPQPSEAQSFVARNGTLKPFSPVHVEGARDSDGNLSITWVRRDRLAFDPTQTEIPMSEDVEDYEVDILDSDGEVRRTISVSTQEAIYSEQQQIDDFGSAQASVSVRVYQMSVQVGRGDAAEATL